MRSLMAEWSGRVGGMARRACSGSQRSPFMILRMASVMVSMEADLGIKPSAPK